MRFNLVRSTLRPQVSHLSGSKQSFQWAWHLARMVALVSCMLAIGGLLQAANATGIATVTSLASSPNPSRPLQSVTFTATVSPSSGTTTPTGTVTFLDGTTTLGTGTLDNTGKATYVTLALSQGSHSITAQYGGDSTYASSTSAVLSQVVSLANGTTMSFTSSEDPSAFGDQVTFTATLTGSLGTPTGTVTFLDGTTTLGTSTLDNTGMATYQTSSLTQGTHSITAQYGGNGTYAGNTSNPLTQKVLPQVTALGNAAITVSGAAGSGTDELFITLATQTWTAQANDSWLHLANTSTSGTGSALIQFSYDANPNNTVRTGTFTIAGVTLTVTQAGSNYAAAAPLVTLTANPLVGAPWQIADRHRVHRLPAGRLGSGDAKCVEQYMRWHSDGGGRLVVGEPVGGYAGEQHIVLGFGERDGDECRGNEQ